jgi:IS4 transposase
VVDKGYLDYNWWRRLHEGQARFVSRLKSNTRRRDVIAQPVHGEGILADNLLKLGHAAPRGGARNELYGIILREIVVERDGMQPLHLVTNDLDCPASDLAALYKARWQVELLFKWLKQNLKIRRFLARSENAVKIQIYVAIIAFLLMRLFQNAHSPSHGAKALITRIAVCLFGRFDITNKSPPPPRHPSTLPPNSQLALVI